MPTELVVALPEVAAQLFERRGRTLADVTQLLDEWACSLDPIRAGRETAAAGRAVFEDWKGFARATVSTTIVRHARDLAEDEGFVAAVAASPSLGRLVSDGRLKEQALPFVLGFGVLAALRLGVGLQAATLREKKREKQAAANERRSASEASETRPILSPLPPAGAPLDAD